MEITQAFHQWANRPDDERFWDLNEARTAAYQIGASAIESAIRPTALTIDAYDGDVVMVGPNDQRARFSHFAFGQFCNTAKVPAAYMRTLPAELAARNLRHGLAHIENPDVPRQILFHCDENDQSLVTRSVTSERYARVWNWELLDRLLPFTNAGWRVPPALAARPGDPRQRPAVAADLIEGNRGGNQIQVGDMIAPAGAYVSDHDCFILMVNPDRSFGPGDQYMRGMIWRNSEVGNGALTGLAFIFDGVCGNHIIWGVQESLEFRLRHVGDVHKRWSTARAKVAQYAEASTKRPEYAIERAKTFRLGDTREEVIEFLFGKKSLGLTGANIVKGMDRAQEREDRYGDPLSAWGFVGGLTEVARDIPYGDQRTALEMAGGKVLQQVNF